MSAPRGSRGRPKPFQRPSVALTGAVGRSWRWVRADEIQEGDNIPSVGLVTSRQLVPTLSDGVEVSVEGLTGAKSAYDPEDQVFCFTLPAVELG